MSGNWEADAMDRERESDPTVGSWPCPVCGEDVELEANQEEVDCWKCGTALELDPDAEVVNGSWVDRSQLVVKKTPEERRRIIQATLREIEERKARGG